MEFYLSQVTIAGKLTGDAVNTDVMRIVYILVTCGLTPCLYFLGIAENRTRVVARVLQKIRSALGYV